MEMPGGSFLVGYPDVLLRPSLQRPSTRHKVCSTRSCDECWSGWLQVDWEIIETKNAVTDLGITLDTKLTLKDHMYFFKMGKFESSECHYVNAEQDDSSHTLSFADDWKTKGNSGLSKANSRQAILVGKWFLTDRIEIFYPLVHRGC
ncbi:hypothetical protein J6590_009884 [Homalodisca vitripennis]|nr:hypothetical protein J6590_009884 [Homalodisca vitripennis]